MNEIMSFAVTQIDLEIIVPSEVRKKKTNILWYHLHVEAKLWYKWTYLENRKEGKGGIN